MDNWGIDKARKMIQTGEVDAWKAYRAANPEWKPVLSTEGNRLRAPEVRGELFKFDLTGAVIEHGELGSTLLDNGKLPDSSCLQTRFPSSCIGIDLRGSALDGANFGSSNLKGAQLQRVNAKGTQFSQADLTDADLSYSFLHRATFLETKLRGARLVGAEGLWGPDRARTVNARDGDWAVYRRNELDKYFSWERLRLIGSLRVFGVSYFGLAIIIIYAHFADWYNSFAQSVRAWAQEFAVAENTWLSRIPEIPSPIWFGIQVLATVILAIAASIYAARCPRLIQENTEIQWTRELKEPVVEYRAAMYSRPWSRVVCTILFLTGGAYSAGYIGWRLFEAAHWFLL